MKTAHIADLHHSPERHKKVMRILDQVIEVLPDVDMLSNSGENFNNPYNIGEVYNQLLDKWGQATAIKPVVTIKATQGKHEREGMLRGLERAGVVILEPGKAYGYYPDRFVKGQERHNVRELDKSEGLGLQLFGVPHAHKGKIVMGGMSRDEANAKVNQEMVKLYKYYGALRAKNPDIPALAVGHGVINGKNTRDLHAIKESAIYSRESEIKLMGCDFHAWGHYHNPTDFELIKGGYLGSFAWDWNELNYKPAITIVDWDTMEISRHELNINVRRKLVMFPGDLIPNLTGCDVHLINNETEWTESDCREAGADQVKITNEVELENKVRSQAVVEAVSYPEKFKAVYPDANDRQLKVCEDLWEADKAEGKIPEKKVITPLYATIHGSKNFLERMGKETVKIDFRDHDGLVMLIGDGGLGKTTLFDYANPFPMLFAQGNSLLSTFELEDSFVEQGWDINGEIYIIKKFFKPTLKSPKAEYYAFKENGDPINGLDSGNVGPYNEWCLSMFGSPRRYSSSVFNTQFDDNPATFQGQKINPSIFQANNIELKSLFHELAGTDLKHLEQKCGKEAADFKTKAEEEEMKKAGVEENIPDRTDLTERIPEINHLIADKNITLGSVDSEILSYKSKVKEIEKLEQGNKEIDTTVFILKGQIDTETANRNRLNHELSGLNNVDIDKVNEVLEKMDSEKALYDSRLKELPEIKRKNVATQKTFMKLLEDWNTSNLGIVATNNNIENLKKQIEDAKSNKIKANSRKIFKIDKAAQDEKSQNKNIENEFGRSKSIIENAIKALTEQIKTGKEMIDNIKKCPECGYQDPEALQKKSDYENRVQQRKAELVAKNEELLNLVKPDEVTVVADYSEEDKEIAEYDVIINIKIPEVKAVPEKPTEPVSLNEDIPTFDMDKYSSLKDQISSYSESKVTELQTKISDCTKRIADLQTQIDSKEKVEIDYSPVDQLKSAEEKVKTIEKEIQDLNNEVKIKESKIADINKMRESLNEYDKRIESYNEEFLFWADMKEKWGPKGIPARILEHTGPYVDQEANKILGKYYPLYKVHSETTKMSSDGKKELEVFNISVVNNETTRTKPLNCISGEERNFVNEALRYAFRKVNEQNSLVRYNVMFEDEPDSHVSSSQLHTFWDLITDITEERLSLCISHSPEIKHRSATTIDIKDLEGIIE